MARFACASLVLVGLAHPFGPVLGQALEAGATFRVFLNDGHALPSYGEYALVGDRIVFVLPIGDPQVKVELQLMSLPVSSIDLPRTSRYADAMRARSYASSRGPAEYSAVAAEVSLALAELE